MKQLVTIDGKLVLQDISKYEYVPTPTQQRVLNTVKSLKKKSKDTIKDTINDVDIRDIITSNEE